MTTIADVIASAREHADQEDSNFVQPETALRWAQEAYRSLYLMMAGLFVEFFVIPGNPITIGGGQESADLPADFLILRGLDDLTNRKVMRKFNFGNRYSAQSNSEYRVVGNKVYVGVDGKGAGTYRPWYVPAPATKLINENIDVEMEPYKEWLDYEVAIKMAAKQEDDISALAALQGTVEERMKQAALNRDVSGQDRIIDVREPRNFDEDEWRFRY